MVKIKSKSKSPHGVSPESFTFDEFEREAINRLNQKSVSSGKKMTTFLSQTRPR